MEMTSLNVRIDAALHRRLRIEAAQRGITIQALIGEIVGRWAAQVPRELTS